MIRSGGISESIGVSSLFLFYGKLFILNYGYI